MAVISHVSWKAQCMSMCVMVQVLTPLAVLSTLQRSTTLTLDVAKTFIQKYVSRQQSNAAQSMAKIVQLQEETAELAERVRTKRTKPLVRNICYLMHSLALYSCTVPCLCPAFASMR